MKRIWHHWKKWECVLAGMYETTAPNGIDAEDAFEAYRDFLRDSERFERALIRVLDEWPISCEQFLSNPSINGIAWLGQASMCIQTGIPRVFRGGFKLLTEVEQKAANALAAKYLKIWREKYAHQDSQIHSSVESA